METVTRRTFVTAVGAAALVPAARSFGRPHASSPTAAQSDYVFFDAAEARFVEAACARLIPADAFGPGAEDAGASRQLDSQLSTSWGAGRGSYRDGPWQPGTPFAICASSPADLFRSTLRTINDAFERRGTDFAALSPMAQDAFLMALQSDGADLGMPTGAFFALLLQMTVESFFSHACCASTRDRIAWSVAGFAGAHAGRTLR
jgi:gluconate 2-dehydrogenase gamma chain